MSIYLIFFVFLANKIIRDRKYYFFCFLINPWMSLNSYSFWVFGKWLLIVICWLFELTCLTSWKFSLFILAFKLYLLLSFYRRRFELTKLTFSFLLKNHIYNIFFFTFSPNNKLKANSQQKKTQKIKQSVWLSTFNLLS